MPIRDKAPLSGPPYGLLNHKTGGRRRKAWKWVFIGSIISGLVTIFCSTGFLSQFPHGEVVLPWQFPLWVLIPFAATGLLLLISVGLRPASFWPVLVGTAAFGAGMFVLRFPIFDEYLAGSVAVGGLIAVKTGEVPRRRSLGVHQTWAALFIVLAFYLTLLSILGFLVWGNPKALRFSMTFMIVLLLGFLIVKYDFPRPDPRSVTLLIASVSLAYYVLYLIHALAFIETIYVNIMEGIGGAGSGYHNVVGVVASPAAFILVARERGWRKGLGFLVLVMALLIAALSDSRGGMMTIIGSALIAPFAIGITRSLKIVATGIAVSILIGSIAFERPQWALDIGESILNAFIVESGTSTYDYFGRQVTVARGDAGRFLYVRAAVETLISGNPIVAFTGSGIYGYFPVAGPFYEQIAEDYGVPTTNVNSGSSVGGVVEPPRPPAMGALFVETGVIGTALLTVCTLAAVSTAIFRKSHLNNLKLLKGHNLLVGTSVALAFAWTYLGEAQDLILFYLIIMPFGLIHTWGQTSQRDLT